MSRCYGSRMMKKIIASLFLTSLLGGCIVHTHNGNRARRGCPPGYYFDHGGCHHDNGRHNGNRNGNGGGVVVRDHRR